MRRSWRWRLNTLQEEKVKDEFEGDEAKQKELEGFVIPIMMKVYQAAGGGGMECGMPGGMPFFAMYGGCSLGLDRGVRR